MPRSERSPGKGNGNSLQYSCLGNRMDRGVIVHGVTTESDTTYQLKQCLNNNNSNNVNYLGGSPYFSIFPICLYPSYPVFSHYIPLITLQYTTYLFVGTFIVNQYLLHHQHVDLNGKGFFLCYVHFHVYNALVVCGRLQWSTNTKEIIFSCMWQIIMVNKYERNYIFLLKNLK